MVLRTSAACRTWPPLTTGPATAVSLFLTLLRPDRTFTHALLLPYLWWCYLHIPG